ncbi:hypothetical protein ACLKA6_012764 [Drosophila palustris]
MSLNLKEQQKLDEWLQTKNIVLNSRTRRDLSDAVTIARLLKKLDARLVNMDNYAPHCSLALKLENWETLNAKVLRRMGFMLSCADLDELAMGKLDALRSLLFRLMCIERDGGTKYVFLSTQIQKPSQLCKKEKVVNDLLGNLSHSKHVPYSQYESLVEEHRKKDKYLSSIQHKVQYLESLILVKEERINKLSEHLGTLSDQIPAPQTPLNGDDQ